MALSPTDIKVELLRRDVSMADIGRKVGVTRNQVSQVIAGRRRSASVQKAVAKAIGKPVREVFGEVVAA